VGHFDRPQQVGALAQLRSELAQHPCITPAKRQCYFHESNDGRPIIDSLSAKNLDDACDLAEIHVFATNDV
jgi:hypothetical protein